MKSVAFLMLIIAVTYAQMPASRKLKFDAEKIASTLQAGPKFVTQNATVLEWPSSARRRVPRFPGWHHLHHRRNAMILEFQ